MKNQSLALKKSLLNMGFSDKEAGVYLALLELGNGTVSQIARRAGINRTSGYHILDGLIAKGLATQSGKEPKHEYLPESPDKITKVIQKNLQKNQVYLNVAKEAIPELQSLYKVGARPKIQFYEGKEGLAQVYENTLTSKETIRAYANIDDMHKALPDYFPEYYKRRAEKGIKIRAIFPKTPLAVERTKNNEAEARDSALVPADKYYFSPEINIYDDKVMIASWREKLGIIIESAEIADAMKKIFELSWQEAKRLEKNNAPYR